MPYEEEDTCAGRYVDYTYLLPLLSLFTFMMIVLNNHHHI
jgi:hypothetical protein